MAENAYKLFECEVWKNIRKETAAIEDRDEQRIREELMDDIMLAVGRYNTHIREWEYTQLLENWRSRGIVFEPCECAPLREKWDSTFRTPSDEPWQFRWEELCLRTDILHDTAVLHDRGENTPASDAFDRAEKSTLAMFFDDCDEAYIIKGCENLTAADVEELRALSHLRKMDIYLMPAEGEVMWSYVTSHEQDCDFGPFFVVSGAGNT